MAAALATVVVRALAESARGVWSVVGAGATLAQILAAETIG